MTCLTVDHPHSAPTHYPVLAAPRAAALLAALGAAVSQPRQLPPPQTFAVPSVTLHNAALNGTRFPLLGMGLRGPGYKLGQPQECFRYPECCTAEYCPSINATRDWLRMGGVRLDTGCALPTLPFHRAAHRALLPGFSPHCASRLTPRCWPAGQTRLVTPRRGTSRTSSRRRTRPAVARTATPRLRPRAFCRATVATPTAFGKGSNRHAYHARASS